MRALLLSLLVALPLFGQAPPGAYTIDPVVPTDRSFIFLKIRDAWHNGCVPRNERITRSGSAIEVVYEAKEDGCAQAIYPWIDDAPLGVLPAGPYSVTVRVDHWSGPITRAVLVLIVKEAEPALVIAPRVVSTAGGTEVMIRDVCNATVRVDSLPVPTREAGCNVFATLRPRGPGLVTVRVVTPARTYDIHHGLHYVDPAAAPDPSLFERVLVPVLYNGPGAFGSQWETDVVMTNVSAHAFGVLPAVSAPLRSETSLQTLFGNRAAGLVLFIPRANDVRFTSHIRDVSRDAAQWGTEMPIVRESDTRSRIVLRNVPLDPRYRLQLRVYGIDGVRIPVSLFAGTARREIGLRGPCTASAMPCNSSDPAYASVDLQQLFPTLSGKQTITLEQPAQHPMRLWAFVTVTNNETQHTTMISPQ